MKYIAILTYNKPHRKTFDLVHKMIYKGYRPTMLAVKYIERENFSSLIQHRPPTNNNIHPKDISNTLGLDYIEISEWDILNNFEFILIGGSGLLPEDVVNNNNIINSHPGYLPNVRGLDALKWAIYECQPIGVTTHIVNTEIDSGKLIEQQIVPINKYDTFHSIAFRQYEMEIEMLSNAAEKIKKGTVNIINGSYQPHRRMPKIKEVELYEKLHSYLKNYLCTKS